MTVEEGAGITPMQCFSSMQSRKLLGNLESCKLCPSMDLVVYNTSASPHQQNFYRTMSWQKVATIMPSTEIEDVVATGTTKQVTCWSPSGKWIAVANDKHVALYGVEPLANPPGGAGFNSESTEAQQSWTVDQTVMGLCWAHVGRAHPKAWRPIEDEIEREISWSTKTFLPPSGYLFPSEDDDHHRHQEETTTTALPESKTPLSVLCLFTTEHLELYLHGRYRLLRVNRSCLDGIKPRAVVSNDLSYFLVQSEMSKMSLYHLPFLKRDRYPLQIVASLHASISSHLDALRESIPKCVNSWKSSLKPLDSKLQPLLRLLQNYGADDQPLGVILKQYILVGHTSESSSVANAMDQFFTSVQMNDQLLQRMERSLHGALANVESQARRGLLSPTQALSYEVEELAGHVQYYQPGQDITGSLKDLIQASHHLWISVHALLISIVEGRHQVLDLCGWLRSAGSQIKARGTAANSVQRENAKKRRVPQAVIERLLASLNTAPFDNAASSGLSEHLLNITTTTIFKDTAEPFPLPRAKKLKNRPESPSSVLGLVTASPTIPHAVKLATASFEQVLVNPLSNIPESIVPMDIRLPLAPASSSCVAMHMRIGRDLVKPQDPWDDDEEYDNEMDGTYFAPRTVSKDDPMEDADMSYSRQWVVVATAQKNELQLFAIPLGWRDPLEEDIDLDEWDDEEQAIPFYLTTKLLLPSGSIRDIGFYGDDGKSSLSSGNDSGTGKERRQKLGILFQQENSSSSRLELWLASYDVLLWQEFPFTGDLLSPAQVAPDATRNLRPRMEGDIDSECAQTRTISTLETLDAEVQLQLCGSRGVGAVAVGGEGVTTIELLDLEEDEEPDDDEEIDVDDET